MNPFQKNPKHASVLAERYFCIFYSWKLSHFSVVSKSCNLCVQAGRWGAGECPVVLPWRGCVLACRLQGTQMGEAFSFLGRACLSPGVCVTGSTLKV